MHTSSIPKLKPCLNLKLKKCFKMFWRSKSAIWSSMSFQGVSEHSRTFDGQYKPASTHSRLLTLFRRSRLIWSSRPPDASISLSFWLIWRTFDSLSNYNNIVQKSSLRNSLLNCLSVSNLYSTDKDQSYILKTFLP